MGRTDYRGRVWLDVGMVGRRVAPGVVGLDDVLAVAVAGLVGREVAGVGTFEGGNRNRVVPLL